MSRIIYRVQEVHCIGCVNRITNALLNKGALHVDFNIETLIAKVDTEEINPDVEMYLDAIKKTGYDAEYLTTITEEV